MNSETVLLVGLGFHYYINLQVQLSARGSFDLSKKDGKIFLSAKLLYLLNFSMILYWKSGPVYLVVLGVYFLCKYDTNMYSVHY